MQGSKKFNNSIWKIAKAIIHINENREFENFIIPGKTGEEIMENYRKGYDRNKYRNFQDNVELALLFSIGNFYLQRKVDKLIKGVYNNSEER